MRDPRRPRGRKPPFQLLDLRGREQSFRESFLDGMRKNPKSIPCRFLYDERGSELFERICNVAEYYLTRSELSLLRAHGAEIAKLIGPEAALIELGSGSSVKTHLLLSRMISPAAYMPVDVSREHLRSAARSIAMEYPSLEVIAVCADYSAPFALPETRGRRALFFPGSTIGNLPHEDAGALLSGWRDRLGPGGLMIVGVDLKKDPSRLLAAYDDSEGVTQSFIKNILVRANQELGADFDLSAFSYEAVWNEQDGCVQMYLTSRRDQVINAAGERFFMPLGERIHVESSYKYDIEEFAELSRRAGFAPRNVFLDSEGIFSVHVLEGPGAAPSQFLN